MKVLCERLNRDAFPASHHLSFPTSDGGIVVVLTGIACVEWDGSTWAPGWHRDEIEIAPLFAPGVAGSMAFALEQWTVFACLASTSELGVGSGGDAAGWAIDKFELVTTAPVTLYFDNGDVPFRCRVAAQRGSRLSRVAYSLTLKGKLVSKPAC